MTTTLALIYYIIITALLIPLALAIRASILSSLNKLSEKLDTQFSTLAEQRKQIKSNRRIVDEYRSTLSVNSHVINAKLNDQLEKLEELTLFLQINKLFAQGEKPTEFSPMVSTAKAKNVAPSMSSRVVFENLYGELNILRFGGESHILIRTVQVGTQLILEGPCSIDEVNKLLFSDKKALHVKSGHVIQVELINNSVFNSDLLLSCAYKYVEDGDL